MGKAPQPSPVGLVVVLVLFAFLIWHGPFEERWGDTDIVLEPIEIHGIDCQKNLKELSITQIEVCADLKI